MKKRVSLSVIFVFLFLAAPVGAEPEPREITGWLEMSRIYPGNLKIRAKLDTGAKSSSLNAPRLVPFQRDGEEWVRFSITSRNDKGAERVVELEKVVHHRVKVKRKKGGVDERPVIEIGVCLGEVYRDILVNLEDRSHFNYQLLIGRDDLAASFNVIVDPSATFTRKPKCGKRKKAGRPDLPETR